MCFILYNNTTILTMRGLGGAAARVRKVIALVFIASVLVILVVEHMCDDDDNDARPHAHNGQMIA